MSCALAGIRVLDLADKSAALAGRILSDLGADVILVEAPDGNSIRSLAPFIDQQPGPENSYTHQYLNAGKRSVVIDLDAEQGAAKFRSLVATADVIIDTERPGRLATLGLGHPQLAAIRPGLIQVSVTPHGLDAPWRHRIGTDLTAAASSGLLWVSGEPRGTPVQGGADPSYAMAGLSAASAALVALTAEIQAPNAAGTHIDISVQEATAQAAMQTANPAQWVWHGKIPRRPGLSAALKCADGGYVGLLVRPDRFGPFLAWLDAVGVDHEMTMDDWEWSLLSAPRKANPVAEATLGLAAVLTRDEFAAGALEADMVCLPVLAFADMERHEQYVTNEQFLRVEHQGIGRSLGFVRSPVDAMADGVQIRPAPMLGADQSLVDSLPDTVPAGASAASAPARAPGPDPAQALAGLRIVDFGWVLAAPIGTRILASFGAEVIRVESAKKPDSMRSQIGPDGTPHPDLGGLFNTVNAGKKSLAIDLSTDAGLGAVKELIKTADVVINNFRPGALERMGLGYETLCGLKDDIVLLNLPGAHRKGPWAKRSSMGNILMAASGFNMLTGFPAERPRGIGVAYPDFTTPHLLVSTVLAALRQRDQSGQGQELHLAQLSGVVSLLGVEWMEYAATGRQPNRRANRDPNFAPHGVYPATGSPQSDDEWVAIAAAGDEQWAALCALMDRSELADDPRFVTHADRKANEDALDAEVTQWTARFDKWDCAEQCQSAGIAAAAVAHLADTYEVDPQMVDHYQLVQQPNHADIDIPIDREVARWRSSDGTHVDHRIRRAPQLGEHNEHVMCELLGESEQHYIDLLVRDVLG